MSNEELERIMNFIIERQEYAATQIVRLTEAQTDNEKRIGRLTEVQANNEKRIGLLTKVQTKLAEQLGGLAEQLGGLAEQLGGLAEQLGDHEERIARFERSYVAIAQLLEKHDGQLVAVTEGLNNVTDGLAKLTTLVNRYITARGDGGNGGA